MNSTAFDLQDVKESFLSGIIQSINGVIILHDLSLNVVFVNDAFETVFEIGKADALGRSPMEFLPEVDRPHKDAIVRRLKKTVKKRTKSPPHEFVYISPQKNYRYLQAFSLPVYNEEMDLTYVMSIIWDITRQKELEQKAVKAARLSSIQDMAYSLAHEINNPLTGIKLGLSTLRGNLRKSENVQVLDYVMKDLNRIQKTVGCFLKAGKDQYYFEVEPASVVGHIIEDVLFNLAGQLDLQDIRVEKDICCPAAVIALDRDRIHQVLLNVMLNAIQAITGTGTITIEMRINKPPEGFDGRGPFIRISIADTGGGILPQHKETVFRPFFSLKDGGTGLGLRICKQVVSAHKGFLEIKSVLEKGTQVDIYLPVSEKGN